MGTKLTLSAWTGDEANTEAAFDEVFDEFERVERLLSTWIPSSDVQRVNQAAGVEPVRVSTELVELLGTARQISEWTGGKFDVTFGALSGLWKFDHDQDGTIPDMDEVRRRLPLIDYRAVHVSADAATVFLGRPGMSIHLGGIGKGYAIDRGSRLLRARGMTDFMIQIGGDLYVAGLKDRKPWRIGIQHPRSSADEPFAHIDLSDAAVSTSGDYERFFITNGQRYHHILDPATGEPSRGVSSVTIVSNLATLADGLSTGVFVMGARAGMDLVERLPDVEAVILADAGEASISAGLRGRIALVSAPARPSN